MRLAAVALLSLLLAGCAAGPGEAPPGEEVPEQPPETDSGPDDPPDLSDVPEAEPREEPLSKTGNPDDYTVFGRTYQVMAPSAARGFTQEGIASWYGRKFHGQRTSSGEPYDMYTMTAAHTELPLPTYARVTNLANQRSVVVKINDRGPFADDRIIDLSYAAADRLGMVTDGTARVRVEVLGGASGSPATADADDTAAADAGNDPDRDAPAVESDGAAAEGTTRARRVSERLAAADDADDEPGDGDADSILVQVGAFSSAANAESLKERLAEDDLGPVSVERHDGVHRVRIGPLAGRSRAESLMERLRAAGFNGGHVVAAD